MKREIKLLLYFHLLFIAGLVYIFFDVLNLIIDDPMQNAILDEELAASGGSDSPDLIPKIIHQTYKTEDIPKHWVAGQQACIDLHPDYEYILWTDEMCLDFITKEYPWFLDIFTSYGENIQRADSIRYFVLDHYGGIYIDLDDGCERKLDPLLKYPSFFRKTSPLGVSNDVIGSVPGHPIMKKLIHSLKSYNINYFNIPYLTIMASTGPMFVSMIWEQYKRNDRGTAYKIMQPHQYKNSIGSFFKISEGSSWHSDDSNFIFKMGAHIIGCVVCGFIIFFFIFYSEYIFYRILLHFSPQDASDEGEDDSAKSNTGETGKISRLSGIVKKYTNVVIKKVWNNTRPTATTTEYQMLPQHTHGAPVELPEMTHKNNSTLDMNLSSASSSKNNKKAPVKQQKRSRKDSNLPVSLNILLDLEKDGNIESL